VNNAHSIAGVSRDGSLANGDYPFCDGLGIHIRPFGETTSPIVRFSALGSESDCVTLDLEL